MILPIVGIKRIKIIWAILKHNVLSPFGSQQSTEDKTLSESGQLFDPQNRLLLHSSSESQSPSFTSQGSSVEQKSSSPTIAVKQQSVWALNPNESRQLFDPHLRLSLH